MSPDHEEPVAIGSLTPEIQNINSDRVVPLVASGDKQLNTGKDIFNLSKSQIGRAHV